MRGHLRVLPHFSNPLAHMHALLSVKSNLAFFIYKKDPLIVDGYRKKIKN